MKKVVVTGGGAAGFFCAINLAIKHPDYHITILEKSPKLLEKVRISGGGRCNVTHACFEEKELVKNYPRGEKELLGPFHSFFTAHTIQWFKQRGIEIKREADGRMFPVSDSSQTIIDCFMQEAKRLRIHIKTLTGAASLHRTENQWQINTNRDETLMADAVVVTTGSAAKMWQILEQLGHKVIPAVPSLFTFNIKDERIEGLSGLSVDPAIVQVKGLKKLQTQGPLLITHWGMSGPAILRLSARGARELAEINHRFILEVNFAGRERQEVAAQLLAFKQQHPKKSPESHALFNIPNRLWKNLIAYALKQNRSNSVQNTTWADVSNSLMEHLIETLTRSAFEVTGKSTNKDEFVTAGGVSLKEVDFKTMQSKIHNGLYFAGEVLDIDAITGGFNFQAAWTTSWIAAQNI
jgi:predicted Rossmann fold flavoprotein